MNSTHKQGLLVSDVARLTGLSRQVIRKWEDRYEIISPKRHENGYRLYTKEDVGTLLKILEMRDSGHSVKSAIERFRSERQDFETPHMPYHETVHELLQKGEDYDEAGLILLLKQAHHRHGLEVFLSIIIQPLLTEIGNRWYRGEWDESQESITSLVIRDFLVQIRRNFELPADAPKMLGCCLPHETHEIPMQIVLLKAMMEGWQTIAAGPSPKVSSIEFLVQRVKPQRVMLSAVTELPFDKDPNLFDELEAIAERNPTTDFYLGGKGALDHAIFLKPSRIRILNNLQEAISFAQQPLK